MLCATTDCTSKSLNGTAAAASKAFPHSRRTFPGKVDSRYASQRLWRSPGSLWWAASDRLPSTTPRICHLHVPWAAGAPRGKRVLPQGGSRREGLLQAPSVDSSASRCEAFKDSVELLSQSIGSDYSGTLAFSWSDCSTFDAHHCLELLAHRHPDARVVCVQRSSETVEYQVSRQRKAVKLSSQQARD